jgi:predicted nucleic acid-binding protein
VLETGSDLASGVWEAPVRATTSVLSHAEGCAALAAARRAGRLSATAHRRARADFDSLQEELALVGVDRPLSRQAGALAERFALRGYDAVHLACALSLEGEVTVVSWDDDLRRAAAASGCALAPAA